MSPSVPPARSAHIAVWGEPTLVLMAACDKPFKPDGSTTGAILQHPGGSAYATAIGCAHLGARVTLVAPIGHDDAGTFVGGYAKERGVHLHSLPCDITRSTVIVVDTDGRRGMVSNRGDCFDRPLADQFPDQLLDEAAVLHLSLSSMARDSTGAVRRLLDRAAGRIPVSIDLGSEDAIVSFPPEELRQLLGATRPLVVFGNVDETAALVRHCGNDITDTFVMYVEKRGSSPARVTLRTAEGVDHSDIAPGDTVTAIDSTGAGDAFAAGFLAAWVAGGGDVEDLVRRGHDYAARAVSEYGTVVTI